MSRLPATSSAGPSVGPPHPALTRVEERFAASLTIGTRLAFGWTAVALLLYMTGLLSPVQPIESVEAGFSLPVAAYMKRTGAPRGWDWLAHLPHGDAVSMAGLLFAVSVIGIAYLAALPALVRRRDWAYVALVAVQLCLFLLAAAR